MKKNVIIIFAFRMEQNLCMEYQEDLETFVLFPMTMNDSETEKSSVFYSYFYNTMWHDISSVHNGCLCHLQC